MSEERSLVKASRIRGTPPSKQLIGESRRRNNSTEEVHPPVSALGRSIIDIEQSQGESRRRNPNFRRFVQRSLRRQPVD